MPQAKDRLRHAGRFFPRKAFTALAVGGLALSLASGCGGSKGGGPSLRAYPVAGTLTMDGQPFGPVLIFLTPTDSTIKNVLIRGEADEKGKLTFTTNRRGDGAPVGEYKVVVPADRYRRAPRPVPEGYYTPLHTPLTVKIEAKKNELKLNLDSEFEYVDPELAMLKNAKGRKRDEEKEKQERTARRDKREEEYKKNRPNPDLYK